MNIFSFFVCLRISTDRDLSIRAIKSTKYKPVMACKPFEFWYLMKMIQLFFMLFVLIIVNPFLLIDHNCSVDDIYACDIVSYLSHSSNIYCYDNIYACDIEEDTVSFLVTFIQYLSLQPWLDYHFVDADLDNIITN